MDLKKKVSLLLAVLALTATATSCGGSDDSDDDDDWAWAESRTGWTSSATERGDTDEESQTYGTVGEESHETDRDKETEPETEDETETETETEGDTGTATVTIPEVYSKYNVTWIGAFENGVAPFSIQKRRPEWPDIKDYFYGLIDIEGNILVDALYYGISKIGRMESSYANNYICATTSLSYNEKVIVDRQGAIIFETGKDQVTDIGVIAHGYFWVETMEETLAGNIYTMRYYSADNLSVIATFEGAKAGRYSSDSTANVSETGEARIYRDDNYFTFNIADYDSHFVPVSSETNWTVDVENIEEFAVAKYCSYTVSEDPNGAGLIATVCLTSKDNVKYYAVVDGQGNVLMKPQKNIAFPSYSELRFVPPDYVFYNGLCPAQDAASGKWGYIDTQGNWMIQPQYTSVTAFSSDGYATVNDTIVIDSDGKVVLSPAKAETNLSGKYKCQDGMGNSYYLTFTTDGAVTYQATYSTPVTGRYQTQGASLTIFDMGKTLSSMMKGDGIYSFRQYGGKLYIDDQGWTLCEE